VYAQPRNSPTNDGRQRKRRRQSLFVPFFGVSPYSRQSQKDRPRKAPLFTYTKMTGFALLPTSPLLSSPLLSPTTYQNVLRSPTLPTSTRLTTTRVLKYCSHQRPKSPSGLFTHQQATASATNRTKKAFPSQNYRNRRKLFHETIFKNIR